MPDVVIKVKNLYSMVKKGENDISLIQFLGQLLACQDEVKFPHLSSADKRNHALAKSDIDVRLAYMEEQMKAISELFVVIDKSGDLVLTPEEIELASKKYGYDFSKDNSIPADWILMMYKDFEASKPVGVKKAAHRRGS